MGYGESCLVNGDRVQARCATGICRSSDNKCVECSANDDCPSDKVCQSKVTNQCVTQQYRFSANCDLGSTHEGTRSQVSLKVKRGGNEVYSVDSMDKPGTCPSHTFQLAGVQPDEFILENHGNDGLGVKYFVLEDVTNDGEIQRWDDQAYCFSTDGKEECWSNIHAAWYPIKGVTLYKSGSVDKLKFSRGEKCKHKPSCSSGKCGLNKGGCDILTICCNVSRHLCTTLALHISH